jgi:DNA primase
MATHDPHAPCRAKRDFTRNMPLAWLEATAALGPRAFTVGTPPPMRLKRADLWAGFAAAQPLPKPR